MSANQLCHDARMKCVLFSAARRMLLLLVCSAVPIMAQCNQGGGETELSGPDAPERSASESSHLFGDWKGARERMIERGLTPDLKYISDSSQQLPFRVA